MAYARTTFLALKDRLAQQVGSQGKFWSEHEREDAINEALAVWQLMTGDFVASANFTGTGNLVEVFDPTGANANALSPVPLNILRVTQGSATLNPTSVDDLDFEKYGWRAAVTGTPTYWAPYGVSHVVVYPQTGTSTTYGAFYYRGDRILTSDSSYVNLGDEELVRILEYAQWYLSFKESPKEGLENSAPLREMMLLAARTRNSKLAGIALYSKYMGVERTPQAPSAVATPGLKGGS
jgi:hypothetical protein